MAYFDQNAELINLLSKKMDANLLEHSLGVQKTARHLALCHDVDPDKAALAGILHDYGKVYPESVQATIAQEQNLADKLLYQEPQLLHAPVGSWLVNRDFNIAEEDILKAIRWHTTGHVKLDSLGLIIYVADFCEPGRPFTEAEAVRKLADVDLLRAAISVASHTIRFLLQHKRIIHADSLHFYNRLIHKKRGEEEA